MRVHFIIHESFEGPAAIEDWAKMKGHTISHTLLYQGDQLPKNCNDFDFLIIMGGPQDPSMTLEECPHFDSQKEVALIKISIDSGKAIFGACLGAQMIGEALGAKAIQSPHREIGQFEITLTEDGKNDAFLSSFPLKFPVGHWHGDMPGLTADSKVLAFSEGCPRQIIKYAPKVYGFQCHLEFTHDAIDGMIKNSSEELEKYANLKFVQNIEQLENNDYDEMNKVLYTFLDSMEGAHM